MAEGRHRVFVVCRRPSRLEALQNMKDGIHPIAADYCDIDALCKKLQRIQELNGPFERVICWVHTHIAPEVPLRLAAFAGGYFCHILSSSAGNPSKPEILTHWRKQFSNAYPNLRYQTVILGFTKHGWLTHSQISQGVYDALSSLEDSVIVG